MILKTYKAKFLKGRALDVISEEELTEGETSPIFISRTHLFENAIEEINHIDNIRLPLDITFHGESAVDLGGPRREFLSSFLEELKSRLLCDDESANINFKQCEMALALHHYFYAGLIIGLNALEGGPLPNYVTDLVEGSSEAHDQFRSGMERTWILQLLQRTTVKYLFRENRATTLNVSKFLHLFLVEFSEDMSNSRRRQEQSYQNFVRYVREVFAGRRGNVTLNKILKFATGSGEEPVLGFTMRPHITFGDAILPSANTCICRLTLPYETTFDRFDLAFLNDHFGYE